MSMPRTAMDWTAERVRALPDDGKRYEVVDGELLVTPSPRTPHQRALGELHFRLTEYVRATGIGEVFFSPSDLEFDARTLCSPTFSWCRSMRAGGSGTGPRSSVSFSQ
jgi:hypothetical protein